MTLRKLMGVLTAVCGMVAYAHFSGVGKQKAPESEQVDAKLEGMKAPMLPVSQGSSPTKQ